MRKSVTFETKCYENDWEYLLCKGYLERMIQNCKYNFKEKVLFINNVNDIEAVKTAANKFVDNKIIDKYYIVEEYADAALKELKIKKKSFEGGYYYSIAELVSIYLCKTDYLLHFSGDSIIDQSDYNWIGSAITVMESQKNVVIANPVWNGKYEDAKRESINEDADWYYSQGFSDQCYLININAFKKPVYNEYNWGSARWYPEYGGELFEKRVGSYISNHNLFRITSKHISYTHENFPVDPNRKVNSIDRKKLTVAQKIRKRIWVTFHALFYKIYLKNKLINKRKMEKY